MARVALMALVDPQSTTFQRSEAWRLAAEPRGHGWRQQWTTYPAIAANLKRAVIAAEDSGFTEHSGVEWDALEKAWEKNRRVEFKVVKTDEGPTGVARGCDAARAKGVLPPQGN